MVHLQIPVYNIAPATLDPRVPHSPVSVSHHLEPRVMRTMYIYNIPSLLASGFECDSIVWQRLESLIASQNSRQLECGGWDFLCNPLFGS